MSDINLKIKRVRDFVDNKHVNHHIYYITISSFCNVQRGGGGEEMIIFDIDGKKILKVSLQMELNILDKKIARILTARNELHQAIADLFNGDVADVEGWTAESLPNIKAMSEQEEVTKPLRPETQV